MKIDYIIPASLTDGFCGQIAFFRASLNALGPPYSDARLVAVFGDPPAPELPPRWRRHFEGIEVEWVYNSTRKVPECYAGQHWRRYEVFRPDCDLVVLCDADVAQLRPMDALARTLIEESAIGGVIAHYHFPRPGREKNPVADWAELGLKIMGAPLNLTYPYALAPPGSPAQAPFYVNYGVVMGTPHAMTALYRCQRAISDEISGFVTPYFAPQVSVALACIKAGLACTALPMRYNYPNDPIADELYPGQMEQIIFLHYLRRDSLNRAQIFANREAFDAFMAATLDGSNEIFRHHVAHVTGAVYPFDG
jgi:hypothetical protein